MNADQFARNVADVLAHKAALKSPEAARKRYNEHFSRWERDVESRVDFYARVVEDAIPTLAPDEGAKLRRIWDGLIARLNANTDEEVVQIDAWLDPLINSPSLEGRQSWIGVLIDCEGGYFTGKVNAELDELRAMPGFDEALEEAAK